MLEFTVTFKINLWKDITLILFSNNFKLTPFTYKVCIHTPSVLLKVFIIGLLLVDSFILKKLD